MSKVKSYTRVTKSGKRVTVKSHSRYSQMSRAAKAGSKVAQQARLLHLSERAHKRFVRSIKSSPARSASTAALATRLHNRLNASTAHVNRKRVPNQIIKKRVSGWNHSFSRKHVSKAMRFVGLSPIPRR